MLVGGNAAEVVSGFAIFVATFCTKPKIFLSSPKNSIKAKSHDNPRKVVKFRNYGHDYFVLERNHWLATMKIVLYFVCDYL